LDPDHIALGRIAPQTQAADGRRVGGSQAASPLALRRARTVFR